MEQRQFSHAKRGSLREAEKDHAPSPIFSIFW